MFEGDSTDTCGGKILLLPMGVEQTINCAQTGSKDPLRRQGFSPHNNNHNLAGAKLGCSLVQAKVQ